MANSRDDSGLYDDDDDDDGLYDDPKDCYPKPPHAVVEAWKQSGGPTEEDKNPTYSTWEYRNGISINGVGLNGNIQPILPRSPSPPPPEPSYERATFDREIQLFRSENETIVAREFAEREERDLRLGIANRNLHTLDANRKRQAFEPYQYLPPWAQERRLKLVPHTRLLDQYYQVEASVGQQIEIWWNETGGMAKEGQSNFAKFECSMMNKLKEAREQDRANGGDAEVLTKVLDEVEKRLYADMEKRFGFDMVTDDSEVVEVVTKLPEWITWAITQHPELDSRYKELQNLEGDSFPERSISLATTNDYNRTDSSIPGNFNSSINVDANGAISVIDDSGPPPLIEAPSPSLPQKRKSDVDVDVLEDGKRLQLTALDAFNSYLFRDDDDAGKELDLP